jgi:hypothetical protein
MTVRGLKGLEQRFIQNDNKITEQEAKQLVDSTRDWGGVSGGEKRELQAILQRNVDKLEPAAKDVLTRFLGLTPTPPTTPTTPTTPTAPTSGPGRPLDTSGANRPVYVAPNGVFTLNANGAAPANNIERGEALFRAGEVASNARTPMLRDSPLATREQVLNQIKTAAATVPAGGPPPAGLDEHQAAQTRTSLNTVLLDLIESSPEASLRDAAVKQLETSIRAETNPRIREAAIFHLSNSEAAKTGPTKAVADALLKELAPTKPPYEKWFANGNKTVNMSWTVGQGEFMKGFANKLKADGFVAVGPENGYGPRTYEKTVNKPGVGETKFRIEVKEGGTDILDKMGDKGVHIVGYDGHSNWGRNMTASLKNGPNSNDGADGQLLFYNLCVGKGVLDGVKEKYPNAQVVTTYAASNFYTDGQGQMTTGEGVQALLAMVDGIAGRQDWNQLHGRLQDAANIGWGRTWDNYITPISTQTREKVLDRDNDGQADYLDKHFNYSTFKVAEDTAREFKPVKQDRGPEQLDGTKVLVSANMINTLSEFSGILDRINPDSKVIAGGWFEPKRDETGVFRFTETKGKDGKPLIKMEVNARYAHMSEEAMRASSVYEFSKWAADTGKLTFRNPEDSKLASMLAFGQSLSVDDGYRDREVWSKFVERYNLPPEIDQGAVSTALAAHSGHNYAGDQAGIDKLRQALPPAVLEALKRPEVGVPVRIL